MGFGKAKKQGVLFDRQKRLTPPQSTELQAQRKKGTLIKTLMANYQLSKAGVYRYLSDQKKNALLWSVPLKGLGQKPHRPSLGSWRGD